MSITDTAQKIPAYSLPQTDLLTVNEHDLPLLLDALAPGVNYKPLMADPEIGIWVVLTEFAPGATLPIHLHTGGVHAYTMSGSWNYIEYPDQPQVAGSYLYEPGSSVHTLTVPADNTEPTKVLFIINGANINFNDDGSFHSVLDAITVINLTTQISAAQGFEEPGYIRGGSAGMNR